MPTTIRPATFADAAAIAHVQVESWRTTYQGIVPGQALAELSKDLQRQRAEHGMANPATRTFLALNHSSNHSSDHSSDHSSSDNSTSSGSAFASSIPVGFISGGPIRDPESLYAPYDCELYALYLLQAHQQQGTGRALIQTLAAALRELGLQSMLVWVLDANPALHFYRHLGAIPVTTSTVTIGGENLPEQALGWLNLNSLPELLT